MKTNFKQGEPVTISKIGKFFMLSGEVVSNNPEADKQLQVDLSPYGVWSFTYADVQNVANVGMHPIQAIKAIATAEIASKEKEAPTMANLVENIKEAFPKEKRAYSKRGSKPKDDKPKRKYNRKKVD